jgi:hypothetical protein
VPTDFVFLKHEKTFENFQFVGPRLDRQVQAFDKAVLDDNVDSAEAEITALHQARNA